MIRKRAYDVAVIGAGPAGVAAAAQNSGRVILIDAADRLGGSVTTAMHRSLCGLYSGAPQNAADTLNGHGQRDIIARMMRREPAAVLPRQFGKVWVLEFPASAWEASLAEVCSEVRVDVRLGCRVVAIRRRGDRITAIRLDGGVDDWIDVKAVIDCTGGGAVLQLAGEDALLPPDEAEDRMLGGYAVRLAGLTGNLELLRLQIPYALAQAVAKNTLPAQARFTVFYPGPAGDEGICKLAVKLDDVTTPDAREFADRVLGLLRGEVPGFASARVVEKSPRALPRDGRRLRGKVVVSEDDVLGARRYGPDAVHAWWPMERWDVNEGPTYAYPPQGKHYDIPDDALRSAVIQNLLAAGACLSATAGAAASIRASGICLATGSAAGRLAAALIDD